MRGLLSNDDAMYDSEPKETRVQRERGRRESEREPQEREPQGSRRLEHSLELQGSRRLECSLKLQGLRRVDQREDRRICLPIPGERRERRLRQEASRPIEGW